MKRAKIVFAKSFVDSLMKLEGGHLEAALASVQKFMKDEYQTGTTGLHLEQLHDTADKSICSIKAGKGNRIILSRNAKENTYLLLYVGEHDPAYTWATNKKISVNDEVGAIQLYNVDMVTQEAAPPAEHGLFHLYQDRHLKSIGVPEEQIPLVRSIQDEEQLEKQLDLFPEAVAEYLLELATGTALSEILNQIKENKDASGGDVMQNPDTLRSFVTGYIDPELEWVITQGDLEQWRIFLHPDQRWLTRKRFAGPALVLGGAGTGKTVTALHRAKALAARMIEVKEEGKLLFTFYTANLVEDISSRLRGICTPEEFKRIHVLNIDKVFAQLRELPDYKQVEILYPSDRRLTQLWEDAIAIGVPEQPMSAQFYRDEWEYVVAGMDVLTLEDYLKVNRSGRGKPLYPEQRTQAWKVFEAYRQLMKERRLLDNHTAMNQYCRYVAGCPERQYRHVLVDETQDFSAGALRLVRALAGPEHEDDLFLVGDTRQRIFNGRTSLAGCGIQVRGRVNRLCLNYRTTYQVQKAAVQLLEGETFDDLNGGTDNGGGYRSCTSGADPQVKFFPSKEAECQWILSQLQQLTNSGVSPEDICLAVSTNQLANVYIKELNLGGIRTYELKQKDDRGIGGVRVGTMHRVKGLEFKYMLIAGVNKDVFPPRFAAANGERMKQARCLMYVALTRAQKGAYVSGYGQTRSPFLAALEKMERN